MQTMLCFLLLLYIVTSNGNRGCPVTVDARRCRTSTPWMLVAIGHPRPWMLYAVGDPRPWMLYAVGDPRPWMLSDRGCSMLLEIHTVDAQ